MSTAFALTTFSSDDLPALRAALKIGLLATVNPEGLPHITMLSSLMACAPAQLCFGQFTEGLSKQFIQQDPRAGFLIMSLDKQMWRGQARFSHLRKEGPEYDFYNNIPMFRYNAYFGVHTVYYLDLIGQSGKQPLPMPAIIFAAMQTMLARLLRGKEQGEALNSWTRQFLNKLDNLKFLAYLDEAGYPRLIPVIQAQSLDADHLLFSAGAFTEELQQVPAGATVAVFGLSLDMEDVLMRGEFLGWQRIVGLPMGMVRVNWVYNAMPPVPGQIYPPLPLEAVREFS